MLLTQVRYLEGILEWLDLQNADEASALHGSMDMTRIGTAGHSRGAKLACLQFAGTLPHPTVLIPPSASCILFETLQRLREAHTRGVPAGSSSHTRPEIHWSAGICSI